MTLRPYPNVLVLSLLSAAAMCPAESPGSGKPAEDISALPAGLTLPVHLSHSLHAGKTMPGQPIQASTTQRTPLGNQIYLPSGIVLRGEVIATSERSITFRFDTITFHGRSQPVATRLLAIASFVAVGQTGVPANGSTDRGNPSPANWTTAQVGGDQVARSGWSGPLVNSTTQIVGSADYWGVYTLPATPGALPHALGPFSAGAQGLFGFAVDCHLTPLQPTISCTTTQPSLHKDDVLLLQVE